jgi:hypothetical protein
MFVIRESLYATLYITMHSSTDVRYFRVFVRYSLLNFSEVPYPFELLQIRTYQTVQVVPCSSTCNSSHYI